jgi:hypothetical protein
MLVKPGPHAKVLAEVMLVWTPKGVGEGPASNCWRGDVDNEGFAKIPGRIVDVDAEDVGEAPHAKVLAEVILIEMPKMSAKFSSHWVEKSCENAPMLRRCIFQGHRLSVIASSNTQGANKFFGNKKDIGFLLATKC